MHNHHVERDIHWHRPKASTIPCPVLADWLLQTGSLTERLKAHCREFYVSVLNESHCDISADETVKLRLKIPKAVKREVILQGDNTPWIYARTLIAPDLYMLDSKALSALGDQPLGAVIFNDPQFIRLPFEITVIDPDDPLLADIGVISQHPLWARRSIFHYGVDHMMVMELFLPESPAYLNYAVAYNNG